MPRRSPIQLYRNCHGHSAVRIILAMLTSGVLFLGPAVCNSAAQDDSAHKSGPQFSDQQLEFFEKRIRPVLVEHCWDCHGPDSDRDGGLSVASRKDLLAGGDTGPAINPGDSQASLLIEALRHGERAQMPPDGKLPVEIQADFIRWVEEKAAWPSESDIASEVKDEFDLLKRRNEHWAWQELTHPEIPEVDDKSWPVHDLDRFILHQLESNQLQPAADTATNKWLRRVHFDLTGLPPTAQQWIEYQKKIEELPAPESSDYRHQLQKTKENVVDGLLASTSFGEHWGRHWLDLVRYAETHGHEFDHPILNAFEYRDYVIRAFNSDVSYQRFVAEHIAGDLLPNPRMNPEKNFDESIIGTSFHYLGEANHAPVDSLIDEAGRMDNQIDVLGKTFMGMTVACARCHDHKFDAISAADYHAIAGILQSTRRDVGVIDEHANIEEIMNQGETLEEKFENLKADLNPIRPWDQTFLEQVLISIDKQRATIEPADSSTATSEVALKNEVAAEAAYLATRMLHYAANQSPEFIEDANPIRHLIAYAKRPLGQPLEDWWTTYREELIAAAQHSVEEFDSENRLFPLDSDKEPWTETGWSFRNFDRQFHLFDSLSSNSVSSVDSRRWGTQLPGTLRSPTFEITQPEIHLKIRGDNGKIRVVVDSYRMDQFSPLLFSDLLSTESEDRWHWRTVRGDLGRYIGHNAFLEIVDQGPGGIAIAEVWMGKPPQQSLHSQLTSGLAEQAITNTADFANALSSLFAGFEWDDETPHTASSPVATGVSAQGQSQAPEWNEVELNQFSNWLMLYQTDRQSELESKSEEAKSLAELRQEREHLDQKSLNLRTLYVSTAGSPEDQAIYVRGNTRNLGPLVPRGNLSAFQFDPEPALLEIDPTGRLLLASQIASPDNPLTARVYVNRTWHWLMGRGIVPTTDNFGVLGELPTNPELLDFLTLQFMQNQWSTKQLVRQIVLSRAYGMSTQSTDQATAQDPKNDDWHSARVKRIDAESIRDAMIQISGKLNDTMYGKSVPTYLTDFMQGRGRPQSGPLHGDWRRSVYLEVRRNFLNPMLVTFDAPIPLSTTGNRNQSNVPAQSLALLNDPLVEVIAEAWASEIMAKFPLAESEIEDSSKRDHVHIQRVRWMFIQAFSRTPNEVEADRIAEFLNQAGPAESEKLERWKALAHSLFNLKEFIYLQ